VSVIRCAICDANLAVPDGSRDWIEHHDDGTHSHHFEAAWLGDVEDGEQS